MARHLALWRSEKGRKNSSEPSGYQIPKPTSGRSLLICEPAALPIGALLQPTLATARISQAQRSQGENG